MFDAISLLDIFVAIGLGVLLGVGIFLIWWGKDV